ncbi:hypothetical protein ACI65C_001214 [Semiaphis heraclei]
MAGRGRNSSKKSNWLHTPPSIPLDKTPRKATTGKQRSAPTSHEYEDSESLSGASYDSYITTPCSSLHSRSQTPIANQQTNPADQNSQFDNNASTAPKTILPPPFFLTIKPDHPWKTIAKELFSIKGHEDVTAKTTTKPQEIKLNCHDEKSFRSIQFFLSSIQEKVGYHTHALPTQRNLKIVIKGLPLDLTNEEITEELTNLGYKPIFIRAFIKNKKRLPIHQVTLTDIESAKAIYQERQLFYVNTNSKTLTNHQNHKNTHFPSLPTTQEKPQPQTEPNKNISYAKATTTNTQPTILIYKTVQIIQTLLESAQKCTDSNTIDDIINTILSIISELSDIQNE